MIHRVFAVFDSKTGAYLPPFLSQNVATARRVLSDLVADSGHIFGRHPEDFILFHLGEWDDVSGGYSLGGPTSVCGLHELRVVA